jgi:fumarate hydratase class II
MEYRIEKDTMGEVKVPTHVYWGAQTQRSIDNFKIAQDINKMPKEIIAAFAYLKNRLHWQTMNWVFCQLKRKMQLQQYVMKF